MVIGAYYLTEQVDGRQGRGPRLPPHRTRSSGPTRPATSTCTPRSSSATRRCVDTPANGEPATYEHDHRRPAVLQRARCPTGFAVHQRARRQEARHGRRSSTTLADELPQGRRGRQPRRHQEPLLPLRQPVRPDDLDRRRQDARPRRPRSSTATRRRPRRSRPVPRGIITDGERRQKEVEIWTNATDEVRAAMERDAQGRDSSTPST